MAQDSPDAAAVTAIRAGDAEALRQLLVAHPGLVTTRVEGRTLLHVATDWPGHLPRGAEMVAALVAAGADVDARFVGSHDETPLHWAASSNDVAVLDALLDAGADIEAPGAVAGGGPPLSDAVAFGQWDAAFRLVERGARTDLFVCAALGLLDRLAAELARPGVLDDHLDAALWWACHGGRLEAARLLHRHGANLEWIPPWEAVTAMRAAERSGAGDVVAWLREQAARQQG